MIENYNNLSHFKSIDRFKKTKDQLEFEYRILEWQILKKEKIQIKHMNLYKNENIEFLKEEEMQI